jgi:hypothetical protein
VFAAFDIPGWIATATIGIVGICVTVYLWWRSRAPKAISYRLTAPAVVSVQRGVEDQVSVLYAGEPVRDVRLLNLRIANTGNGDIKPEDFEVPFSVALGKGARVLSGPTVGNTNPSELRPELSLKEDRLVIAPLLLNGSRSWRGGEGDWFEVTSLVSQLSQGDRLTARIAGVPKILDAASSQSKTASPALDLVFVIVVLGVLLVAPVPPVLLSDLKIALEGGATKTDSKVVLRAGDSLCGDILRVGETTLVLKLQGSGTLRILPLKETRSIKDDAC